MAGADARRKPWSQGPEGLTLGGVPLASLVEEYGSPLYVLDGASVLDAADRLQDSLGRAGARLYLAGKSNPNPYVWKRLREEGVGLDACSPGEVEQALAAGFQPAEISFTGCALTLEEMDYLAASGVEVNLDAADQALTFSRRHPGRGFGLRLNPGRGAGSHDSCTTAGSDAKLGVPWGEVPELVARLRGEGAALQGLHCHTGSGGLDVEHFVRTAEQMASLVREVGSLEWLSLGGGLGVPHHPSDPAFDLERYAACLADLDVGGAELRLEPGQAYVSEAGVLVMTVVSTKRQDDGTFFALTDSSFNHYLGTSLYASWHELVPDLPESLRTERPEIPVHVCGHLCNTGDVFARGRNLPRPEVGDRLLMATCGAYGISRAANYNSRPIPAEVWVEDGEARLIRRRQSVADLSQWYVA